MASLALAGAVLAGSPGALAAQSPALTDCFAHGQLTGHYSTSELRIALNTIPVSATQYTVCYDVIQRQLLAQVRTPGPGTGSGSSSGGSFLPTPVIVVLVLLALGAVTFAAIAIRSRGAESGGPPGGGPPGGPGEGPPDGPA
jgi:hypothetical protein